MVLFAAFHLAVYASDDSTCVLRDVHLMSCSSLRVLLCWTFPRSPRLDEYHPSCRRKDSTAMSFAGERLAFNR